jgi:DNA-binding response OmpR family regulator
MARILIIDDSSTNNLLLKCIFEEEGAKVFLASNGIEGLTAANKIKPDIILLDIMMPRMDGFRVLSELRQSIKLKRIPVIMITARRDSASMKRAYQLGAVDYIVKPIGITEIIERVKFHLIPHQN